MTTLSDVDICREIEAGRLVVGGATTQVSGACYELRLGDVYYDLTESDVPITVDGNDKVLIKPGHRVVLITHEELNVPHYLLARVVSKGSLFSIGLSPVATYADPGFSGNIGIVTQNISDKYIVLPRLEPIAKVDFTQLSSEAERPYSGQHGFRTQIWPIKHQLQKTYAEVKGDSRIRSEKEEAYLLLPHATSSVLRNLEARQNLTDWAILVAVILNAVLVFLVGTSFIDALVGLAGNLVASIITGIVVWKAKGKK